MVAYRGRTFGQLFHRLLTGNSLAEGTFEVHGRTVSLADVAVPVLVLCGANDAIAPMGAVKAAVPLLTGSREVRFEIVPGGHLGMLTGRAARTSTWPVIEAWVDEWTGTGRRTATQGAATKRAARRTPAKKSTAPKSSATKSSATASGDEPSIGANRERRYGSSGSRALRR
jgi:polyhydroxyalkanoate synthase